MESKYNVGNKVWCLLGELKTVSPGVVKEVVKNGNGIIYTISYYGQETSLKPDRVFSTRLDAVNSKFKETGGCNKWSIGVGQFGHVKIEFDHYPNVGTVNLYNTNADELRRIGHMFLNAAEDIEFLCDMKNLDE